MTVAWTRDTTFFPIWLTSFHTKNWRCVLYLFYLFIQIQLRVSLEPKGNLSSLMLHVHMWKLRHREFIWLAIVTQVIYSRLQSQMSGAKGVLKYANFSVVPHKLPKFHILTKSLFKVFESHVNSPVNIKQPSIQLTDADGASRVKRLETKSSHRAVGHAWESS